MKNSAAQHNPSQNFSAKEMLEKLISFDTISAKSNLHLMAFVQEYLEGFGIASHLIHDATGTKANLHAVIGPRDVPGVILSGHTDVVPVAGQAWESDPFSLHDHDDLLYGRGTCDMKGFIAVVLSKVPGMVAAPLTTPLHFAFSYDEEIGCLGVHSLADFIAQLEAKPKLCIVGEPTMMKAITGHKGICDISCCVQGKEAHSSLAPYAVNAVEAAAELVTYIRGVAKRMAEQGPFNKQFDPPYTTLQTGIFQGGTAYNIVPNICDVGFEIRNIPEVDSEAIIEEIRQYAFRNIEPRMKDIDPKSGFSFQTIASAPAFDIRNDDPAVAFVQSLSGSNETEKVSFATEAGIFSEKGVPTVVCGPGSITQAHKPNEFVAKEQILKCEVFIDRLLEKVRA